MGSMVKTIDFISKNADVDTETIIDLLNDYYRQGYGAGMRDTGIALMILFVTVDGALYLKDRHERRKKDTKKIFNL